MKFHYKVELHILEKGNQKLANSISKITSKQSKTVTLSCTHALLKDTINTKSRNKSCSNDNKEFLQQQ